MDPFVTRDYGEAILPLDVNALTILQKAHLCSAGLVDCSTPRQGALGAEHRALYGLEETRGRYTQQGLRALELTLFLPDLAHFLSFSVLCVTYNPHIESDITGMNEREERRWRAVQDMRKWSAYSTRSSHQKAVVSLTILVSESKRRKNEVKAFLEQTVLL